MDSTEPTSNNTVSRQSPKDVLYNLRAYYNDEIMRSIELQIDFSDEEPFFQSLKTFLNDFEDASTIDMLFNSSLKDISEEMDLYKRAEQSIIKTIDRPVFLINDDQIDIAITTPWQQDITQNLDSISNTIRAVGRIEITGDERRDWAGTGWLLRDKNIIVTNRHVAVLFATSKEGSFQIKEDWMGDQYGVRIDFKEEQATRQVSEFDIKEVVYIAKERDLDIALLRVERKNNKGYDLPEGLELSYDIPSLKEDIYIVGYPACLDEDELKNKHFNGTTGVKQFAPGAFFKTNVHKYIYLHDCTTWGGNSGSPVIDFKSGKVIGIHYAGTHQEVDGFRANYAVSGLFLAELLEELGI